MEDGNEKPTWPLFTTLFVIFDIVIFIYEIITALDVPGPNSTYFKPLIYIFIYILVFSLLLFFLIKNYVINRRIKKQHQDNTKSRTSLWIRVVVFIVILFGGALLIARFATYIDKTYLDLLAWLAAFFIDSILSKPVAVKPGGQKDLAQIKIGTPAESSEKSDTSIVSKASAEVSKPVRTPNKTGTIISVAILIAGFILMIWWISQPSDNRSSISGEWTRMSSTSTPISYFTPVYVNTKPSGSGSRSCVLWSEITLADVGKTMCVYGTVRRTWFSEQQWTQYFTFSSDPQAIYFQKFSYVFDPGLDGRCVQFTGEILQSYSTPYMDLLPEDVIYLCD